MAKGISYVQRTLRTLESQGRISWITETWNHHAGIRQDLFGIVDILTLDPVRGFVGVQVCGQDWQPHVTKMTEEKAQECFDWLSTPGGKLELWGWRKVKKRLANGKKGQAEIWAPRIADVLLKDGVIICLERKR